MRGRESRVPFGRRLLAILFPERCAACDEVIRPGEGMCSACRVALPYVGEPICPFCGLEKEWCHCRKRRRYFERVIAPFYYDGTAKKAVLRMKKSGDMPSTAFFAWEMAQTVRQYYADVSFDGVVFIPSDKRAIRRRGFNPSRLIAKELARLLQLPLLPVLCKVMENAPQKTLSAIERSGNVLGVFDVLPTATVDDKVLLLVDDIITTGATMDECAKMLKLYGAREVYAVVGAAARQTRDADADTSS